MALAAGSVAGVAKAIEFGLAKLIGLVINLFAKLIGLGGLAKKVQAIFGKIRKRIDKAVNKLLKKAQKAGRKLLGKLGIGKKKGFKPTDDKRSQSEMKKDLHSGIKEGTEIIRNGQTNKKEINKKFKKIQSKYLLQELRLVQDNRNKVHIYAKVNPDENGPSIDWNVTDSVDLTQAEIKKLNGISGGQTMIQKIDNLKKNPDQKDNYIAAIKEVRVLMSLKDNTIFVGGAIVSDTKQIIFESDNNSGIQKLTEIDILTDSEMIEVKSGNWALKESLSQKNRDQFEKLRNLSNGRPPIKDHNGVSISLTNKKLILQVEQNGINARLLAEIVKYKFFHSIRLGNGSMINVGDLKSVKASSLKGKGLVSSSEQYNNLS